MSRAIYKKLLDIQKEVRGLMKDKQEATKKFSYVSGEKVLGFIRPKMDDVGLLLIPEVISSNYIRQDYSTSKGAKNEMFVSIEMKFTWVDTETDETLECKWASSGMNNFDKSLGSALTYGERYFLLKFFHIPTDIDDVDAKVDIDEDQLKATIAWIDTLKTPAEMEDAWNKYGPYYGKEKAFVAAFTKHQKEIANGTR